MKPTKDKRVVFHGRMLEGAVHISQCRSEIRMAAGGGIGYRPHEEYHDGVLYISPAGPAKAAYWKDGSLQS